MTKAKDIWYRSLDGLQLYACDYCPAEPIETIVCMHGLTRNSKDFDPVVELLSEQYRVITVDLRGRGRSQWDRSPANYQPACYVQDMFILFEKLNLGDVILLGTSLGGLMSMLMSAMHPEKIKAVIVNDIGPEIHPEGLARIKSYVGKSKGVNNWAEATAQVKLINQHDFPDLSEKQWSDFALRLYRENQAGIPVLDYDPAISQPMIESEEAAAPTLWDVFEHTANKPLLLIRGALSDILTDTIVHKMLKVKPDISYCCLSNRGHAPLLSESKAQQAIKNFLVSLS